MEKTINIDFLRFYLGVESSSSVAVDDSLSLLLRLINNEQGIENLKQGIIEYKKQFESEKEFLIIK
tara:strand:- start:74 stop:271 length:198 start_codon:yes stop_codon:yes gene_type:complete